MSTVLQEELAGLDITEEHRVIASEAVEAARAKAEAEYRKAQAIAEAQLDEVRERAGEVYDLTCSAIKQLAAGKDARSPMWKYLDEQLSVVDNVATRGYDHITYTDREEMAAGWLLEDSGLPTEYYQDVLEAVREAKNEHRGKVKRMPKAHKPRPPARAIRW